MYTYSNPKNPSMYARHGRVIRTIGLAAAVALGALVGSMSASTIIPVAFPDRVSRAELIIDASVVAIDHRNSDVVEPGDREIPHTFVTFAISEVVKGRYAGSDKITLRFMGGPSGKGTTTKVIGLPQFKVGDREILFIHKNGGVMCPLIGWGQGRLRVIRDSVLDDDGFRVWITPAGKVARGEMRLDLRQVGYPTLTAKRHSSEPQHTFAPPTGSVLPSRSGLVSIVKKMVELQTLPGASAETPSVSSVDIATVFRAPRLARRSPRPTDADIDNRRP